MNAGSGDVSLCVRDIICSASKYTHKEPFTGIRDPRLPGAGGLREDTRRSLTLTLPIIPKSVLYVGILKYVSFG